MAESGVAMMQAARTMPMRGTNRALGSALSTGQPKEDPTAEWTTRAITAAVQGVVAASHSLLGGAGVAATAANATHVVPSMLVEARPPEMLALTNAPHAEMEAKESTPHGNTSTGRMAVAQSAPPQDGVDVEHNLGDVEAQLAALRDVAPKAKAKSKAKSFCKRPATKASLKRPAAAVAPWGVRHPRVPQLVSVKSTARHLRDVVSAQKERQSLRARLRLRPHLRVRPGVEPFWQWCQEGAAAV